MLHFNIFPIWRLIFLLADLYGNHLQSPLVWVCWGIIEDVLITPLHRTLSSSILWMFQSIRPVHSRTLSFNFFFWMPSLYIQEEYLAEMFLKDRLLLILSHPLIIISLTLLNNGTKASSSLMALCFDDRFPHPHVHSAHMKQVQVTWLWLSDNLLHFTCSDTSDSLLPLALCFSLPSQLYSFSTVMNHGKVGE